MSEKKRVILGLDLSLSGTGLTILDSKGSILFQALIGSKKENTKKNKDKTRLFIKDKDYNVLFEDFIDSSTLTDMPRLSFYRNKIKEFIVKYQVTEAILEGYSMGSKGQGVTGLAELGGIIRMMLYDMNIPYVQSPPYNAKAYISGISVAEKEIIIESILEKYNLHIEDDNIADSFSMANMLLEFGMDQINSALEEGGVDLLKNKKGEEFRYKMHKGNLEDKIKYFKKILNIGQVSISDVEFVLKNCFENSLNKMADSLTLDINFLNKVFDVKKPSTKHLNENYRYKKPKKT